MDKPEIVSVVGGGDLGRELNLEALSDSIVADVVKYDPEHWPGLYIKFDKNSPAIMVFRTGKYNIAGASSKDEIIEGANNLFSSLDKLGVDEIQKEVDIRNFVFMNDFQHSYDLERISILLGLENIEYEPEQFPGLMYRPTDENAVFLIFSTGRIILTGINDKKEAEPLYSRLHDRLSDIL